MHKKIGNLSFSIKNQTLFIKEYCQIQKGMVIDFGTFPVQCLGIWVKDNEVIVMAPNLNEYTFHSNSEHNARTFVTKLSNEIERFLFSENNENSKNNQLRIEDKGLNVLVICLLKLLIIKSVLHNIPVTQVMKSLIAVSLPLKT